jgi:aminopeptidase N
MDGPITTTGRATACITLTGNGTVMPRVLAVSACFLFLFFGEAYGQPVAVHHDLRVALHPDRALLTGSDTLQMRLDGTDAPLVLRLSPRAEILRVYAGERTPAYRFEGGELRILQEAPWSDEARVTIDYAATFTERPPLDPTYTENPGYGVDAVISPQGVFLASDAGWYPDIPGSRPTFRVRIETPAEMEAVTDGRRILHRVDASGNTSIWEVPYPSEGLALSAGPYHIASTEVQGIPVYTYLFADNMHLSETYLEAAAGYLRMYQGLFGPYPFEKYAVVENFFPTGYGFPSYALLGGSVLRLPFIVHTSLGHEIAHAWWGNGVRVQPALGNWSEGLTTYVADHLYKERESAAAARQYRLNLLRDYATLVDPANDLPLTAFRSRTDPASRAVGYGKGAMVFHMLRRLVGEQNFWQGLRELYRKRRFQAVSWYDFAGAFQQHSRFDLQRFLRQWIERPGAPQLTLEEVHAEPRAADWEVSAVLRQDSPHYRLKVPVRLESASGHQDRTVFLEGAAARLGFRTESRPQRLVVDPDVDLFRRLDPEEIPPIINRIKGSSSLVVDRRGGQSPAHRPRSGGGAGLS